MLQISVLFLSIEKILQVWERETEGRGSDERKHVLGLESWEPTEGTLTQCPHTSQTRLERGVTRVRQWRRWSSGLPARDQGAAPVPRASLRSPSWPVTSPPYQSLGKVS